MNDDKNLLGRLTALALILAVVYGVHGLAHGRFGCPLATHACCGMSMPKPEPKAPAAPKAE